MGIPPVKDDLVGNLALGGGECGHFTRVLFRRFLLTRAGRRVELALVWVDLAYTDPWA